jgi:DNA-directed RNA polymerase II subunit RPB2
MKKEMKVLNPNDPANMNASSPEEMVWTTEEEDETYSKVFIGNVPVMLKSFYCHLHTLGERELFEVGECPYDQV